MTVNSAVKFTGWLKTHIGHFTAKNFAQKVVSTTKSTTGHDCHESQRNDDLFKG